MQYLKQLYQLFKPSPTGGLLPGSAARRSAAVSHRRFVAVPLDHLHPLSQQHRDAGDALWPSVASSSRTGPKLSSAPSSKPTGRGQGTRSSPGEWTEAAAVAPTRPCRHHISRLVPDHQPNSPRGRPGGLRAEDRPTLRHDRSPGACLMLATRTAGGNLDSGWTAFLNSEPRSLVTSAPSTLPEEAFHERQHGPVGEDCGRGG